jgi:16S rRNA (uracil1498-N3)-methyltransferase
LYTDQALTSGEVLVLQPAASHYLCRVLRARRGFIVRLFNGLSDADFEAVLEEPDDRSARLKIGACIVNWRESPLRISLAQALCRGEKMDLVLQKAVELGVCSVQPLVTERTEVHLDAERTSKRGLHWRGVVLGACEQSGRARVPELCAVRDLDDWLASASAVPRVALDPNAASTLGALAIADAVCLIVGPEGGFSDRELASFEAADVQRVRLGPRVLRTETAGLAAIAALQARFGDFC